MMNQLNVEKKRANVSQETTAVLKGELEGFMLKLSENSTQDMSNIVEELSQEKQARAELEAKLNSLKCDHDTLVLESQATNRVDTAESSSQVEEELSRSSISIEEVNQKRYLNTVQQST